MTVHTIEPPRRFGRRTRDRIRARLYLLALAMTRVQVTRWSRAFSGRARAAAPPATTAPRAARNAAASGQEQPARAVPPLRRVPVRGPVVLDDRPHRAPGAARPDGVDDVAAGLVGDPPPVGPEPPAQVDVLEEQEEPLVPAADPVERVPAEPDRGARDPLDVRGHAPGRRRAGGTSG